MLPYKNDIFHWFATDDDDDDSVKQTNYGLGNDNTINIHTETFKPQGPVQIDLTFGRRFNFMRL